MRLVVRYILFILSVVFLIQCEKEEPFVNITDNNFLNALIKLGIDTDKDRQISYAEAEVVISLVLDNCSISDMTGIERFVNLELLLCFDNNITSLDVSNNTALVDLVCSDNKLTSLDVSNNTALVNLFCDNNNITTLDVSNNTALVNLFCDNNNITTLDVSNNPLLGSLYCSSNQLTTLDVSNNTALQNLVCRRNQFTNLNISRNTAITNLDIREMPTLNQVCVWESFPAAMFLEFTGSPNVYFTTDCN